MRKYRNYLICFSLVTLVAAGASAQIVDEKAATDFSNFYTGADLTTSTDWTLFGTLLGQVEDTSLRFQVAASGGASYQWGQVLPQDAGWTMEWKLQVTQPSTTSTSGFGNIVSDGTKNQYNLIHFSQDGVEARGNTFISRDLTDGMHTIRIAETAAAGTGQMSLWIDETLYSSGLSGFGVYEIARCWLGEYSGTQVDGEVLIDHVAIDTTGAYAPIGQVIPTADPVENMAQGASDAFTYKYEMDCDPTDPTAIDLDLNGQPDFGLVMNGTSTYEFTPEGTWSVQSPAENDTCYFDGGMGGETLIWSAADFTAEESYTVEVRVKVTEEAEGATQVCSIAATPQDSGQIGALLLNKTNTAWYQDGQLSDADNSDDFHVYRFVRDSITVGENLIGDAYWVWRDGVLLTEEAVSGALNITRDALYFGDMSGTIGGAFEIDYIRFTQGMYAPEGWTYPADDIEGDLNGDGMVGSADLDIVRGNWGQSVVGAENGDANGDGVVGSGDLDIVRANWGATAAAAVPEPGTVLLLLAGVVAVLIRRR